MTTLSARCLQATRVRASCTVLSAWLLSSSLSESEHSIAVRRGALMPVLDGVACSMSRLAHTFTRPDSQPSLSVHRGEETWKSDQHRQLGMPLKVPMSVNVSF